MVTAKSGAHGTCKNDSRYPIRVWESQAAIRSDFPFSWSSKKKGEKAKVGMMLYEIFKFVISNAKYQRKRLTFKWRKFDQERDP